MVTDPALDRLRASYDRTHDRLWRAVLAWSGSRDVADDSVAEAFAQAASRGDAIANIDGWVWRAAFRIAAGELKRRRRDGPLPRLDGQGVVDGPGADVVVDLVRALAQLSPQQRACVILRDLAGLPAREAAAALGTTPVTVRVQALRARRRLRELLEDRDD